MNKGHRIRESARNSSHSARVFHWNRVWIWIPFARAMRETQIGQQFSFLSSSVYQSERLFLSGVVIIEHLAGSEIVSFPSVLGYIGAENKGIIFFRLKKFSFNGNAISTCFRSCSGKYRPGVWPKINTSPTASFRNETSNEFQIRAF